LRRWTCGLTGHGSRDADTTWFRQCLQPRGYVDPVAVDVVFFGDHVSEIDADAEPDALLIGHLGFPISHRALDLYRATDRIYYARKFHQHAVAGVLYNATTVFRDLRINQLAKMSFEAFVRAFLIRPISRE